jgi:ribosomal protein L40E
MLHTKLLNAAIVGDEVRLQKGVLMKLCPYCQEENYSDANFCRSCRASIGDLPLVKICPYCFVENPADANFCQSCQSSIAVVPPETKPSADRATHDARSYEDDEEEDSRVGAEFGWNPADYVSTPISSGSSSWTGGRAVGGAGRCPRCGSTRVQLATEGESQGFGAGKGCLGAIIFGPIGFLCGLCGMGKGKTETVRMCVDCGKKF